MPVDGQLFVWLDQDEAWVAGAHLERRRRHHAADDRLDQAQMGRGIIAAGWRQVLVD